MSKYFGPSTLIAAAFIGPGTVTTCTIAGVTSQYTLLWALVFSIVATIVLQEMSARVGWVTGSGIGESINKQFNSGLSRQLTFGLVVSAILIGNAAYEAGNLSGGVLGLNLLLGEQTAWPIVIVTLSFILLYFGNYKLIEKVLITLVVLMSICFLITAIMVRPNLADIFKGFVPGGISEHLLLILGLIGTTVVPYNLFLHASTISKKYDADSKLSDIRRENYVAIILGGAISILIVITAASNTGTSEVSSAADLAVQLEPTFGIYSKYLMGIGLMAAGCSSALTAPLAAAYAAKGLFGWEGDEKDNRFRAVWFVVLLAGAVVLFSKVKLITIIKFAQIANAILLPFIALFLIYLSNKKNILGAYINNFKQNIISVGILVFVVFLSLKSLAKVFQVF